jgi:hypothetical protein
VATEQRRDRTAEAATARVAAGDNAAFGVTSGTMILGALLAPKDGEHSPPVPPDQQKPDATPQDAATHSTPATTIPAELTTLPSSNAAEHASDQLAPHSLASMPEQTHDTVNLPAPDIHGSPDFSTAHDTSLSVRESGSASAETKLPEPISETHSHATDLTTNLSGMVDGLEINLGQTLDALLGSTSELSALWQQTTAQIDHTIGELIGTIENLANTSGLLDLANTLDHATSGIIDALEIPAPGAEHGSLTSSATDSSGVMSAIADLAGSLLGVTQHNDTLDQAYGTAAHQNTAPADTLDIGSLPTADTGPISISFMGQSYTDAFDTHDVTHHASHTLHGLV